MIDPWHTIPITRNGLHRPSKIGANWSFLIGLAHELLGSHGLPGMSQRNGRHVPAFQHLEALKRAGLEADVVVVVVDVVDVVPGSSVQ